MYKVIDEGQENFAKIANLSNFFTFLRILHFPENSGHIGILPSEIGFAFPFSACFIARVRDLRFDAPAEQWMDVERDEKFGNATDTQLPSMRVCGDECIISTPIIFYRWDETLQFYT